MICEVCRRVAMARRERDGVVTYVHGPRHLCTIRADHAQPRLPDGDIPAAHLGDWDRGRDLIGDLFASVPLSPPKRPVEIVAWL